MRSPNATLPATSRCGNSAYSWNIRPNRRRCGGTAARSSPSQRMRPGVERLQAGDRAQQRGLAAAARPEDRDRLAGADLEVDAVDGRRRAEPHHRAARPAASELAELAHAHLLDREHDHAGHDHQHRRHRHRLPDVQRAGPGEEPRDRDRDRRACRAGRRTTSRRTRRATPRPRTRSRPRTPASRSAGRPRATPAAAARRAPRAASRRRGSIDRNAGTTARITNGMATTACASGTSTVLARRSSGQRSSATRKPNPTVTADVPSGSISSVSIARVARPGPRRDHHRRQTADHHRDHRRDRGELERVAQRLPARARTACRSRRSSSSARYDASDQLPAEPHRLEREHEQRPAEEHDRSPPSTPPTTTRSQPARPARGVARRDQPLRDRPPLLHPRQHEQQRDHRDHLHERERGRDRQVEQLHRLAVDLDLERRVRRVGEQQHHAERGEREQEHDRRGRRDRRAEQRQRDLAERARPRRAEHARRVGAARVELRPEAADRAHDHRDVEEHLRDEQRADAALPAEERRARRPGRNSTRNAVATTTVGSTNGTVTNARNSRRPGNS